MRHTTRFLNHEAASCQFWSLRLSGNSCRRWSPRLPNSPDAPVSQATSAKVPRPRFQRAFARRRPDAVRCLSLAEALKALCALVWGIPFTVVVSTARRAMSSQPHNIDRCCTGSQRRFGPTCRAARESQKAFPNDDSAEQCGRSAQATPASTTDRGAHAPHEHLRHVKLRHGVLGVLLGGWCDGRTDARSTVRVRWCMSGGENRQSAVPPSIHGHNLRDSH